MKKMKGVRVGVVIFFAMLLLFMECKKSDNQPVNMYYDYFPIQIGAWVEYDVREIQHTSLSDDTVYYLLREVVADEFIDNEGRLTHRIERFWKDTPTSDYTIKDVWYSNRNNTTAEKVEENVRFTRLVFPVSETQQWDGNALNHMDEWEHEYEDLHISKNFGNLFFDSTIKVQQIDNINPFQYQVAYEIYANRIGLIRKSYINIDNDEGNELEMTVIAYGQ